MFIFNDFAFISLAMFPRIALYYAVMIASSNEAAIY